MSSLGKILGATALALTGFGALGMGPLAALLGKGAAAGAAGAAGSGAAAAGAGKAGFGTLLKGAAANTLASTGTSMALNAMMPQQGMTHNLTSPGMMQPIADPVGDLRTLMENRKLRLEKF